MIPSQVSEESLTATFDLGHDANSVVLKFKFAASVVTTIRIVFDDEQSGADMLITNMTTFPESLRTQGFGSAALQVLIICAERAGFNNVQATQVRGHNERFWIRNGFLKLGNTTNDFRYSDSNA